MENYSSAPAENGIAADGERFRKLVLLHSNDMHGDFLAENVDRKLVGGVGMLSGYINKVKEEEPNTLYCIAGDMFRGSVIDSEFHGMSTIEIMNMISPDVVTLGNHEVDYGVAHLLFLEKCAKFPIINANFHIKTNGARLFKPYLIKEIGGIKILFIGILTELVVAQAKNDGMVGTFVNITEAAEEIGRICNAHNSLDIDFTVLLTHIGFEEDKKLAALLDPAWGVDVIIGGHSHTFLKEAEKVNDILIVQAGTGTDQIGRFDIIIDTEKNCVAEYKWQSVPIDAEHCPVDHDIEKLIDAYKSKTDAKYGRVVTRFNRKLTHPCRTQETALGDLMADALKESLGLDIMLLGSGSVRTEELGPIVMLGDLTEAFPYDDEVFMVHVRGDQLKRMIKHTLRDEVWEGAHSEFYQYSEGLHMVYSKSEHEFREFKFKGEEVADDRMFTVGLQLFHYNNMENSFGITHKEILANAPRRTLSTSSREVIEEFLSENQHLDRVAGDRLIIED
ncbi:MAG: bifunctional metallophosphatase/5'-nucleotidase [Clostridia bacterium]|nr:bifunctional metallophosphatase/5'-nucleotidase [Clostridia bacterium]